MALQFFCRQENFQQFLTSWATRPLYIMPLTGCFRAYQCLSSRLQILTPTTTSSPVLHLQHMRTSLPTCGHSFNCFFLNSCVCLIVEQLKMSVRRPRGEDDEQGRGADDHQQRHAPRQIRPALSFRPLVLPFYCLSIA